MLNTLQIGGEQGDKRQILPPRTVKNESMIFVKHSTTRPLSVIETLPNELIQEILWDSLNLNLTTVSPILARKLNSNNLRRKFIFLAFFEYMIITEEMEESSDGGWETEDEMERMTFYHARYGTNFDQLSQRLLVNSIMDQAWFSAELFFSCQQEYLSKIVPAPFSDLLASRYKVPTKPWTILQQNTAGQLPLWLVSVSSISKADKEPLRTTEQFYTSPITSTYTHRSMVDDLPWQYYDAGRFCISFEADFPYDSDKSRLFRWYVGEDNGLEHQFAVAVVQWSHLGPEPNPQILNPVVWTPDSLALLNIIFDEHKINCPTRDLLDAACKGIMTAIAQKHVPTVFTLCWIPALKQNNKLSQKVHKDLVVHIVNHASQNTTDDLSMSAQWISVWISQQTK